MSVAVLQEARRAPVRETPTHYDFVPLTPGELSAWDILIRPYDSRELFHSQAWLDYLAASRGVEIQRWAIHEDTIGELHARPGKLREFPAPEQAGIARRLLPKHHAGV